MGDSIRNARRHEPDPSMSVSEAAERKRWREDMREASRDPLFLADIAEVERDFAYADAEAARIIDEWENDGQPR